MNNNVLIVDDEVTHRELLRDILEEAGFCVASAENGWQGWSLLEQEPDRFAVVLLDRMMPVMNGMVVMSKMKHHAELKYTPVIMQTAMARSEEIVEGLNAGAYYYLTKPYPEETVLLAIVQSAIERYERFTFLKNELSKTIGGLHLTQEWRATFQTLEDATNLASLLAKLCPTPLAISLGLVELLINAIEHGNLELTYEEKNHLKQQGVWQKELDRRLLLPKYAHRRGHVHLTRDQNNICIMIEDEGNGFDWQPFIQFHAQRAFDINGRGISMTKKYFHDHLEFLGSGNKVMINLPY